MIVIFNFSAQVAEESQELSSGITEVIIETVEKIAPDTRINHGVLSHYVRKNAHFSVYLLLGMLVVNALMVSFYERQILKKQKISIAILACIIYAISDELHQTFVPGRGGQVSDVILDSIGAGIGIYLYFLVTDFATKIRNKTSKNI